MIDKCVLETRDNEYQNILCTHEYEYFLNARFKINEYFDIKTTV